MDAGDTTVAPANRVFQVMCPTKPSLCGSCSLGEVGVGGWLEEVGVWERIELLVTSVSS